MGNFGSAIHNSGGAWKAAACICLFLLALCGCIIFRLGREVVEDRDLLNNSSRILNQETAALKTCNDSNQVLSSYVRSRLQQDSTAIDRQEAAKRALSLLWGR